MFFQGSDFGIIAEEDKLLRFIPQFAQKFSDTGIGDRSFKIEVEHIFKLSAGNGTAFQFGEVQPEGGELGQHRMQRTGTVGKNRNQTDLVRTGENLRDAGNADEAGVVVVAVLDVVGNDFQIAEITAVA